MPGPAEPIHKIKLPSTHRMDAANSLHAACHAERAPAPCAEHISALCVYREKVLGPEDAHHPPWEPRVGGKPLHCEHPPHSSIPHHLWLPDCLPLREGCEKERHLLDCKVRSLTSGVKAPRPRAERAASRKTYSVLGFRPSTVKEVVGSKFLGT